MGIQNTGASRGAIACFVWFACAAPTAAQPPPTTEASAAGPRAVLLEVEDCLGTSAEAVRRIVSAELGGALLEGGRDDPTSARVAVRCGVESAVLVVDHPRGVRLEQRLDLSGAAASTRGRLLALSIAELLNALWHRVDALPPPTAAPPPEPVAVPAQPDPPPVTTVVRRPRPPAPDPPPGRPLGIQVLGALRVAGTPVHAAGGGGVGVEIGLPLSLGVGADVRYEYGRPELDRDTAVEMHAGWAGLRLLVRPVVGPASLALGLGGRAGLVWLTGRPSAGEGRTHQGVVAGPTFLASTSLLLAGRGYLFLGLEVSWMLLSVSGIDGASGAELARFGGPQIVLLAGFELQPLDS